MNFKPFWIETNQIFDSVTSENKFTQIKSVFLIKYPDKDIMDLKIAIFDYDENTGAPKENRKLVSFGSRSEHIHNINYTLKDYFNQPQENQENHGN